MSSETQPTAPDDATAPLDGPEDGAARADDEVTAEEGAPAVEDTTADEPAAEGATTDETDDAAEKTDAIEDADAIEDTTADEPAAESEDADEAEADTSDADETEAAEETEAADGSDIETDGMQATAADADAADGDEAATSVRPPDAHLDLTVISAAKVEAELERHRRRWPWVAALLVAFAVFTSLGVLAGATMSYAESLQGRLLPGTAIAGMDVGGMTHDEALETVRGALAEELDRRIVVRWQGERWTTTARELGAETNARDIIADVAASQQGLAWQDWARLRWLGERADESAVVDVTYSRAAGRTWVRSIAADVNVAPTDSELSVDGKDISVGASAIGYKANRKAAVDAVMRSVEGDAAPVRLRVKKLKPAVTESDFSQVLLLDQSDHRLTLFLDGEKAREWIVATGTGDFPTPLGRYHIELKRYMPTWVNPSPDGWGKDMPESIPPGPKNPLGVRALNWSAPAIRFHGTQAVNSLGTDASHGCVRMHNNDVSELYDLVDVGAVIISQE